MSPSLRNSAWSNSGMVVETRPEDLDGELAPFLTEAMADGTFAESHQDINDPRNPLRMMYFQEALEKLLGSKAIAPKRHLLNAWPTLLTVV